MRWSLGKCGRHHPTTCPRAELPAWVRIASSDSVVVQTCWSLMTMRPCDYVAKPPCPLTKLQAQEVSTQAIQSQHEPATSKLLHKSFKWAVHFLFHGNENQSKIRLRARKWYPNLATVKREGILNKPNTSHQLFHFSFSLIALFTMAASEMTYINILRYERYYS